MHVKQDLYTFIINYKGGTYIRQLNADNIKKACDIWLENLDYAMITKFSHKSYMKLCILRQEDGEVIAIENTKNVWCFAHTIKGSLFLVNIIKTIS